MGKVLVMTNGPLYEGETNYGKGAVLEVTEERAKSLGDAVHVVTEEELEKASGRKPLSKRSISDNDIENRALKAKK